MDNNRYTTETLEALKNNVKAKKLWIAQTAATYSISDSDKLAIEKRLPKISSHNYALNLIDVYRTIEVYNDALQEIVSTLCDKFNLTTPACNYFSSNNKG